MNLVLAISHFHAATGGAEAFAVLVARRLAERGHRLTVVAEDGEGVPGIELVRSRLDAALERTAALGADLLLDWGLNTPAGLHRLGGGVHREFLRLYLAAFPRPVRLVKGFLYRCLPRHRALIGFERRLLLDPGAHFLAVSNFVRDQVLRAAPVDPRRLHVLHNGVDIRRFHPNRPPAERRALRRDLGLGPEDVAFLFVAHNLKLKNIGLLKRVFPLLHRADPAVKLLILGRRNPGIDAPWAVYVPGTDRPENVYAAADVLVHPTYYDACANVVLEALASGLPVVSSDRNGSAELIEEGRNGFVRPVIGSRRETAREWHELLADLARDPVRRQNLGTAARETAERHAIEAYIDAFECCLERVIAARRTRR